MKLTFKIKPMIEISTKFFKKFIQIIVLLPINKSMVALNHYFPKAKKFLDKKLSIINQLYIDHLKLEQDQTGLKPVKYGLSIIAIFFGVFFFWAWLMPINSSSIASGVVVLDFNRKTIQHLEGGIIQEILVKEGSHVTTGSDLVILQNIQAKAQAKAVQKQLFSSQAIYQRLITEQDYNNDLDLNFIENEAKKLNFTEAVDVIKTQNDIFKIKKEAYFGKIDILNKRINQLEQEIEAKKSALIANDKQLEILKNEQEIAIKMVELRNIPITDKLAIEKQIADLEGRKGSLNAEIAKSMQSISETNLEIINFSKEHLNAVLAEKQEIEERISGLTEQFTGTSDVLKRTVIKAPASGIVMDLKFHTKGAVVPPGGEIMHIVPQDEELIIEARINPQDIDNVKQGLKAKINLSAFKAKKVPKLDGVVASISADILTDEISGENYFLGRIKISEDSLSDLKENIQLYPGMPAEVFIITGSRTLLQYLISPISDAAYKAIRDE